MSMVESHSEVEIKQSTEADERERELEGPVVKKGEGEVRNSCGERKGRAIGQGK